MDQLEQSRAELMNNFDRIVSDYTIPGISDSVSVIGAIGTTMPFPGVALACAPPLIGGLIGGVAKKVLDARDVPDDLFNVDNRRFYDQLCRYADERGIEESELYKRACLSRSVYSKIRNMGAKGNDHKPSKLTVLQLCIALRLNVRQTIEMLQLVGYSLSNNIVVDKIVAWCLSKRELYFDVDTINDIIFEKTGESPFNRTVPA